MPSNDDPWAVFGDEGDDSCASGDNDVRVMAQALVSQANDQASNGKNTNKAEASNLPTANLQASTFEQWSPPPLWPNQGRPLYCHPHALLVSNLEQFGGGRGYVATTLIPAGALILVDPALIAWPVPNLTVDLDMVALLLAETSTRHWHALEHFYPTKSRVDELFDSHGMLTTAEEDITSQERHQIKDMMDHYRIQIESDAEQEQQMAQLLRLGLTNSNGTTLTRLDLWRLLLALRYNSLETGIYLHVAMLNHADVPNCVKFKNDNHLSEVRATRDIGAGEPLTISYLPRLLSHASRRSVLWHHHRFDIGTTTSLLRDMELVKGELPPSNIKVPPIVVLAENDDDGDGNHDVSSLSIPQRVEKTLSQLEEELNEIMSSKSSESLERAKALELALFELCNVAPEQLHNASHILLLPARQLHLQVVSDVLLLRDDALHTNKSLWGRLLTTCLHLWELQERVYGPHYFGLAQTLLELAQAIERLLVLQNGSFLTTNMLLPETSLKWLQQEKHMRPAQQQQQQLSSATVWSSLEHAARTQHQRIKALYPKDEVVSFASSM